MNILESIVQALQSIRANKLRTVLTLLSISIGIFAIIGAGTAVNTLEGSFNSQLIAMGQNTFMIKRTPSVNFGNSWRKYRNRKDITLQQAKEFKMQMEGISLPSIHNETDGYTAKSGNVSTDPTVTLIGADENFFIVKNFVLETGRAFGLTEVNSAIPVVIIGNDLVVQLFNGENPLGQFITLKNQRFQVIGTLKTQGSMFGRSLDAQAIIPITVFSRYHSDEWTSSVEITTKAYSKEQLSQAVDVSIGIMRSLRNLKPWEENSFEVETNESVSSQFASFSNYLQIFALGSGLISLLAAGVGIMNIMLVSVKERTKEIGIRKAIGAKRSWILYQFIIEAITLCQLGGLIGIVFGVVAGQGLGALINTEAAIPLNWVLFSIIICTLMGLAFGSYPAWKAASLDPIEALRYE
ncbi:FtsX-like permease family protein [bacterium]|nr:FtsX-like permease family protein [bacterium]